MMGPGEGDDGYELSPSLGRDFNSMTAVWGSRKELGNEHGREKLY